MKKLYFYFIAAGLVCLAAACNKEADVQAPAPEAQTQKVIIHAGMEGGGTKVVINSSTGKFSWSQGDKIAVHTSGAGWVISDGLGADPGASADFTLSLTDAERDCFAVYPYSSAKAVTASSLTISYPESYNLKSLDSEDASLVMVAKNAPEKDLEFKHVGAILRLTVKDVPKGANRLYVYFLDKKVHGNFDVTGLDSEPFTPTVSATSGSCRVIFYFPSSLAAMQDVVLNIPVPTGDLGRIKVQAADAGGYDFTNPLTITGPTLARAHGKKMEMYLPTFSVSATKKVIFSPGNLQASTTDGGANWTWAFAAHQYDVVGDGAGTGNQSINGSGTLSVTNGTVDTFGWSTATHSDWGINNSTNNVDYAGEFVDWGRLKISSYPANTWRTLTGGPLSTNLGLNSSNVDTDVKKTDTGEFAYLLAIRSASTVYDGARKVNVENARFVKGMIGDMRGAIILPDHYVHPAGIPDLWYINRRDAYHYRTTLTVAQWEQMEAAGAVFLPAGGRRWPSSGMYTSSYQVKEQGVYWTSTVSTKGDDHRCYFIFGGSSNTGVYNEFRIGYYAPVNGLSVRLVRDAN